MSQLEKMDDFFAVRVDDYDAHMINEVEGCKEGYKKMAEYVPESCRKLLDLGCGTGLELEEIFNRFPDVFVTGIDLCEPMLSRLSDKYSDKNIKLICGDYLTEDFGENFDCAVSFQTMHHLSQEKKVTLYRKIFNSLTKSGCYIECDYMVETEKEQAHWMSENKRLRKAQGITSEELYHYDIPFTVENQIKILCEAGFGIVEKVMRIENTTMLVARK